MSETNPIQKTGNKRGPKRAIKPSENDDSKAPLNDSDNSQPGTSNSSTNVVGGNPYRVQLSLLNPYITCSLCNGYFIDAVTVMDCLHTFCKSCLIKYFEDHNDCPSCHTLIHQSHPTHYVSFDRTLQEIVYKLVPGLQAEEQRRRETFLEERQRNALLTGTESGDSDDGEKKSKRGRKPKNQKNAGQKNGSVRNGVCGTKIVIEKEKEKEKEQLNGEEPSPPEVNGDIKQCCTESDTHLVHHRREDAALVHLVPADDSNDPIHRPFIRVSVFATINTLKRTLACYLRHGDISQYNDFDIFCNNELMGRDFSMMFIQKTRWRDRSPDEPIRLVYKIHKEF